MKRPSVSQTALALILLLLAGILPLTPQKLWADEAPKSTQETDDPGDDLCRENFSLQDDFFSKVSRGLYTSVCATSRWFDAFFGDARAHDEYANTYGSLSLGLKWTEYDSFDPILRARINLELPIMTRKFNVFIGRLDPDEYVRDSESYEVDAAPSDLRNNDESWILGLGTTRNMSRHKRISFQVGLRASLPLDPYAKTQYRWYHDLNPRNLLRYRQTLFWFREKGYGTTTNLDLEYRPSSPTLLRLSGRATIYEESKGWEWLHSLIAFHRLSKSQAIGCRLWIKGKTKADVAVEEYGAWIFFRRRLHREWLFTDFGTGVSWPREKLQETRRSSWGLSAGLQIQFGRLIARGESTDDLEEIQDPPRKARP